MAYWLIKSEPFKYAYDQLEKDGRTFWDGVRNYQARSYLQAMKEGDLCLYYHSNEGKEVIAIAQVIREWYPDPTAEEGENWAVVDVAPYKRLPNPVSLATLRATPELKQMGIFKQMRLSVVPVTDEEFNIITSLGGL